MAVSLKVATKYGLLEPTSKYTVVTLFPQVAIIAAQKLQGIQLSHSDRPDLGPSHMSNYCKNNLEVPSSSRIISKRHGQILKLSDWLWGATPATPRACSIILMHVDVRVRKLILRPPLYLCAAS